MSLKHTCNGTVSFKVHLIDYKGKEIEIDPRGAQPPFVVEVTGPSRVCSTRHLFVCVCVCVCVHFHNLFFHLFPSFLIVICNYYSDRSPLKIQKVVKREKCLRGSPQHMLVSTKCVFVTKEGTLARKSI